jgi:hypothetical protein
LRELARIGFDPAGAGIQEKLEIGALTQCPPEHSGKSLNRFVDLEYLRLQNLPPAKCQELSGDCCRSLGSAPYLLEIVSCGLRQVGAGKQELGGTEYDGHLVIRLMGNATRELAHHFHSIALAQSIFRLPARSYVGVHFNNGR